MSALSTAMPVNLLTGFLGSGKTTLLRRLLRDPALAGAAVLINEFGEIGLDHHLIERIDEMTVLLQSGCLCCTIRGELSEAMRDLYSRRARGLVPAFDRLVIESTGLADPFPILSTIRADPVLSHHFTLGNVVATIDAVNAPAQMQRHGETLKQIASADRIVLTKTDLVTEPDRAALVERLRRLNPAAPVVDVHAPDWSVEWLMAADHPGAGAFPEAEPAAHRHTPDHADAHAHAHQHDPNRHGATIRAFAITIAEPVDWTGFGIWLTMLLNRHGAEVLRVKGILNVEGEARPVAVHGVQHLVHPPTHLERWASDDRRSHLVFIVDGLAPERICASFEAFGLLPGSIEAPAAAERVVLREAV